MKWKVVFNCIAALAAGIAALLWHRSATVKIGADPPPRHKDGGFAAQIRVDDYDFIATAVEQTRWSRRAAVAAALAAAFQAVALVLPG